jgi:hypothetical protein
MIEDTLKGPGKQVAVEAHPQWVKLSDRLCGMARLGALALVRQFRTPRPDGSQRGGCYR